MKPVILFDGVCNFCNSSVHFIIQRDKKKYFRFAAFQSEAGQQLVRQYRLESLNLQTLVLIKDEKVYMRSSAALRIARKLSGGWAALYPFIIIPSLLRDIPYKLISKNRYRWFGRKQECMIPSPDIKERFLTTLN